MPYVQVWVDESETCKGNCPTAEKLLDAINKARQHLSGGESSLAEDCLNEAVGRPDPEKARRATMEALFKKWEKEGRPGPFWEVTHGHRHVA